MPDILILDEDGLYDPAHFNDRLLLGLKGTMSSAGNERDRLTGSGDAFRYHPHRSEAEAYSCRFEAAAGHFDRTLFDIRGFAKLIDVWACQNRGIYPLAV